MFLWIKNDFIEIFDWKVWNDCHHECYGSHLKIKFLEFKISKTSLKKEGTFDGLNNIISELHLVYFRCYIVIIINDIFHYIACKYSCQFNAKNSMPFFLSLNYFMQPSDCDLFFGCHSTTLNGSTTQN